MSTTTTTPRLVWNAAQEAEGYASRRTPHLTDSGMFATVWRQEPGIWAWQISTAAGLEVPSFQTYRTPSAAQRAAEQWWHEHGRSAVLPPKRRMFLGQMRGFLRYTGA